MIFIFSVCRTIPKIYSRAWQILFLNFGPPMWPPMTSSNSGPFFHSQTLINWRSISIFFDEIWKQSVFSCLKHIENNKTSVFSKSHDFHDFPKIPILDHFWATIFNREIYLMSLNLMILLVLLYIYHFLQKLGLHQF